jgi:hypothetical protein
VDCWRMKEEEGWGKMEKIWSCRPAFCGTQREPIPQVLMCGAYFPCASRGSCLPQHGLDRLLSNSHEKFKLVPTIRCGSRATIFQLSPFTGSTHLAYTYVPQEYLSTGVSNFSFTGRQLVLADSNICVLLIQPSNCPAIRSM